MREAFSHVWGLTAKLAVIAIALGVISHADSGETTAATVTVNVGDLWFCNSSFSGSVCPTSIRTGDTVTWNWVGSASHSTLLRCEEELTCSRTRTAMAGAT